MRYKVWRSNKDKELHLLCAEGVLSGLRGQLRLQKKIVLSVFRASAF